MTAKLHLTLVQPESDLKVSSPLLMISSGKGGVGKTWFATALAEALALNQKRVLLVDGDLDFPNVDVHLGLSPRHDIAHTLDVDIPLEEGIVSYQAGGYDVLMGRSGSGDLYGLNTNKRAWLLQSLENLSRHYDHVIVDTATGITPFSQGLVHIAACCCMILTESPTSLGDTFALTKTFLGMNAHLDFSVIVNQAENIEKGRDTYEAFTKMTKNFLGFSPSCAGIVRCDPRINMSIDAQTPLSLGKSHSDLAKDIFHCASYFIKPPKEHQGLL